MSSDVDVDVVIVGTGQAGVPLAGKLAAAGKKVVILERGEVGGTCSNTGCTPTKTLVASARAAHVARTAARLGVNVPEVHVDFAKVIARKDAIVERWRAGVLKHLTNDPAHLTLVRGQARFTGERRVEVNGQTFRAEHVVINVGGRPRVPSVPGLAAVPFLNNRTVMALETLPEHLLVLGGGYIGCEFAQAFRRFGAKVTVVDTHARLLSALEPEVGETLGRVFTDEGIALELSAKVERTEGAVGDVRMRLAGGRVLRGSHLLVATGRRPNTDDLGAEKAGVRLDANGFVEVDEHFATSAKNVWAVGDCTGEPQFTHVAWDDHRLLARTLLSGKPDRARTSRHIPFAVFVDPQIAGVGLTEAQAKAQGIPFEVARYDFGWVARAIETDETAGFLKILVSPVDEKILGASFMGAETAELLHMIIPLMEAGVSARAIVTAQMVHPAFAEGVQSALMTLERFNGA